MFARQITILAAAGVALAVALPTDAFAGRDGGGGGGKNGDTFIDDAQKNPRFIEPGAENDPARYRVGAPREGFYDRQAAQEGYSYAPYGRPAPRRGRVTVEPYYYR